MDHFGENKDISLFRKENPEMPEKTLFAAAYLRRARATSSCSVCIITFFFFSACLGPPLQSSDEALST